MNFSYWVMNVKVILIDFWYFDCILILLYRLDKISKNVDQY